MKNFITVDVKREKPKVAELKGRTATVINLDLVRTAALLDDGTVYVEFSETHFIFVHKESAKAFLEAIDKNYAKRAAERKDKKNLVDTAESILAEPDDRDNESEVDFE